MSPRNIILLAISCMALAYFGVWQSARDYLDKTAARQDQHESLALMTRLGKGGISATATPFADEGELGLTLKTLLAGKALKITREVYGSARKEGGRKELRLELEGKCMDGLRFMAEIDRSPRPMVMTKGLVSRGGSGRVEIMLEYISRK